ncbi:hypothetical protein RB653_002894 [Dictyostelium firmibasis]|uniref:Transmembrane protein n=1 Tax=Dictyostelium firmibasis TaxID=79012 RepID=A0AAN7TY78_9MYCE
MNNQFTYEFNNYLKVSQAKPIRVILTILIGFGLLAFGEFSFFNSIDKMQIIGCSLQTNIIKNNTGDSGGSITNSNSLENCFYEGFKFTTCLNEQFNTGSNYSLTFSVSMLGLPSDKYSTLLIASACLLFFGIQIVYQLMHYFNWIKRKRIQQILSEGQIFLNGNKKYEKRLTLYFLFAGLLYIGLKMIWIVYRNNHYSDIVCNDNVYNVNFFGTLTASIGTLITSAIPYLLFPLIFLGGWINYLSDLDFKKMTDHLSHESMKQIKNISTLDFSKYNSIIDSTIPKKHPKDSKFKLFLRKNTFSFLTTPTSEIVEILLSHKNSSPQDFEPMLYNEQKLSKLVISDNDENEKLIN